MTQLVYIDGTYCPPSSASISIFDRGFLFGDSIYEVIPVYHGRPFFVERHLNRLKKSLEDARIRLPVVDWHTVFTTLLEASGKPDVQLYIQITRGNHGIRKHDVDEAIAPTVIAYILENAFPKPEAQIKGLSAKIINDIRWEWCHIKSNSLMGNILMNDEAVRNGFDTAILDRNGYLTEGASSNIFVVFNQTVHTSPIDHYTLAGITQQLTIEVMEQLKKPVRIAPIKIESLRFAEEVWVTSTTKEIYPVTSIDHQPVGSGKAGALWKMANDAFQQLKAEHHE